MAEAVRIAVSNPGCGVTVHAGEWAGVTDVATAECETLANIRTAVELGVDRLGHGLQMGGNKKLLQAVREAGIHVECNPFGNMRLLDRLQDHPIREFIAAGLAVSLNCDNTLFSGTTVHHHDGGPTRQTAFMVHTLGMDWDTLLGITLASIDAGFNRTVDKEALKCRVREEYMDCVPKGT